MSLEDPITASAEGRLPPYAGERSLLESLRGGDEAAFVSLIEGHHDSMVRVAMAYVPSRAVAEEVAQEAWVGVLEGLDRFEGRSSLKTWMYRILVNRAISRGQRERRTVPFSSLFDATSQPGEPSVDPDRFRGPGDEFPGNWASPPVRWDESPEGRLLSAETLARVREAIDALPGSQRAVITLRDVTGLSSQETCNVLGITETNQRVLLHRARTRVRRALERYLDESA